MTSCSRNSLECIYSESRLGSGLCRRCCCRHEVLGGAVALHDDDRSMQQFPLFCFALLKSGAPFMKFFRTTHSAHSKHHFLWGRIHRHSSVSEKNGEKTKSKAAQKRNINYQTQGAGITNRVQSAFDLGHILFELIGAVQNNSKRRNIQGDKSTPKYHDC